MPQIPPAERYSPRIRARQMPMEEAREAALKLVPDRNPVSIQRLTGGFSNASFVVDYGDVAFYLRIFPEGIDFAGRESAILKLARNSGIKVPAVLGVKINAGPAAILEEFIPGTLLSEVLESRSGNCIETFQSLGKELAKIHSVRFETSGTFGAEGEISDFGDFPDKGVTFIHEFLSGIAGTRLGPELTGKLKRLVDSQWHLVSENWRGPTLVHCDFNPKNILVDKTNAGEVSGILDWEFAISGDPLIDLGNFFRFENDYTAVERDTFLESYRENGGFLPDNWRRTARLHDLVSMCAFLASKKEFPKSFRTARMVIEETLCEFGVPTRAF